MPNPSTIAASALILTQLSTALFASAPSTYQRPPESIARILEAAPSPSVSIDPTRTHMVFLKREALPPISDLAAPMLRIAGLRLNPNTNGPHGPRANIGMSIRTVADATTERNIALPDASIGSPLWAADGSKFAFSITFSDRVELWLCDVKTATAKKLIDQKLNAAGGGSFRWMPDGTTLLVKLIPANRGPMPVEPPVPVGPVVQETFGTKAQQATYQDLLKSPFDEMLFDWIMPAQLAYVDTKTAAITPIGEPAIFGSLDPSPDGQYLLSSRIIRPYSYTLPASGFPEVHEIRDAKTGKVLKQLHTSTNREQIPIDGVEQGPRDFEWIDTAAATLLFAEALDEGNPKNKVPHRDSIFMLAAPFDGQAKELIKTEHRYSGTSFLQPDGTRSRLSMISEYDRDRKWRRTWLVNIDSKPELDAPRLMRDLSVNDRYNDPGSPLSTRLTNGRSVVRVENGKLFLTGSGATPKGNRPFLDEQSLADFSTKRIWRSDETGLESVIDVLSDNKSFITSFQSPSDVPNYYMRTFDGSNVSDRKALTTFDDPVPELRNVKKELITYKRADGTDLSATMYLPPDYKPGTRLPLVIWAYPLEYTDKSTAGQVSASPNTFVRMGGISHLCLVMAGYAVMDSATMPVVGDPQTVNDTFVEQIVSSAQAAIDKAVDMGVADRDRVAVGGHSYGAFMTANLLAHCDLFRAGLARSGAYNRTLTPFGFQGEKRTYWEATDTYTKMSPFTYADRIKTPLLMIHGQIDNNPGTFPIQSDRLFAAIKGLGGTARLVTLPYESHGYAAKESSMQVQYEMVTWLDTYVKNATPRTPNDPVKTDAPPAQDGIGEIKIDGRIAQLEIYAWRDMMPGTIKSNGLLLSAKLSTKDGKPLPAKTDLTNIALTQNGKTFDAALTKERDGSDLERMLRGGPDFAPKSRFDARVKVILPDGNSAWVTLKNQEVHRAD